MIASDETTATNGHCAIGRCFTLIGARITVQGVVRHGVNMILPALPALLGVRAVRTRIRLVDNAQDISLFSFVFVCFTGNS